MDRIGRCSSVFFTEDFTDGLAALGKRLDLPLEARRVRVEQATLDAERRTDRASCSRLEPEYELLRRLEEGGIVSKGSIASA